LERTRCLWRRKQKKHTIASGSTIFRFRSQYTTCPVWFVDEVQEAVSDVGNRKCPEGPGLSSIKNAERCPFRKRAVGVRNCQRQRAGALVLDSWLVAELPPSSVKPMFRNISRL
jgi:hypothetical protein